MRLARAGNGPRHRSSTTHIQAADLKPTARPTSVWRATTSDCSARLAASASKSTRSEPVVASADHFAHVGKIRGSFRRYDFPGLVGGEGQIDLGRTLARPVAERRHRVDRRRLDDDQLYGRAAKGWPGLAACSSTWISALVGAHRLDPFMLLNSGEASSTRKRRRKMPHREDLLRARCPTVARGCCFICWNFRSPDLGTISAREAEHGAGSILGTGEVSKAGKSLHSAKRPGVEVADSPPRPGRSGVSDGMGWRRVAFDDEAIRRLPIPARWAGLAQQCDDASILGHRDAPAAEDARVLSRVRALCGAHG